MKCACILDFMLAENFANTVKKRVCGNFFHISTTVVVHTFNLYNACELACAAHATGPATHM